VSLLYIFMRMAAGITNRNWITMDENMEVIPICPSLFLFAMAKFISSMRQEPQEITVIPMKIWDM